MTGLRVLEAVVRSGSLSAAARELCVTPAAVSHRLRSLEAQGNAALVRRVGGRFVATDLGQRVLDKLGDSFLRIRAADAILSEDRTQALHISASYSFAVLWLAPRLSRFRDHHPEVQLHLEPSHTPLQNSQANVVILHAIDPPERNGWTQLFADTCVAVARANHPIFRLPDAGPADALKGKLVHISHAQGPELGEFSWRTWAEMLDLAQPLTSNMLTVSAEHLAVDLVLAEDVFALVSLQNAGRLIGDGQLRAVQGSAVNSGRSYWARLGDPEGGPDIAARKFLSWLQDSFGL
jgi:LysR family transcriptional regulator, glycine cleavage system transcriptional activator